MATRPVFLPTTTSDLVLTKPIEFKWFPGMSVSQKQKSIASLHNAACEGKADCRLLEVSSKSSENIGLKLGAFNLHFHVDGQDDSLSVECAFQGSKVFQNGGPYTDLYGKSSLEAKRDKRLHESGRLVGFSFFDEEWPLEPKTAFYDWLYITALKQQSGDIGNQISDYSGFTDIEFNPKKSINCQAYSLALYIALTRQNLLENSMENKGTFLEQMIKRNDQPVKEIRAIQGELFP